MITRCAAGCPLIARRPETAGTAHSPAAERQGIQCTKSRLTQVRGVTRPEAETVFYGSTVISPMAQGWSVQW